MPRVRPVFICIDGILTNDPDHPWGTVRDSAISKLKKMYAAGIPFVLWSSAGADYAKKFAEKNYIYPVACIDKPGMIVDPCSTVRPKGKMPIVNLKQFSAWDFENVEDEWESSKIKGEEAAEGLSAQAMDGIVDKLEEVKEN